MQYAVSNLDYDSRYTFGVILVDDHNSASIMKEVTINTQDIASRVEGPSEMRVGSSSFAQKALSDMIEIVASDNLWLMPDEFIFSVMGKQLYQEAERYGKEVVDKMLDIGSSYSGRLDILQKLVCSFGQSNTLIKREFQIASMIMNRETYAEIVKELKIVENTVKFHVKNIYNKLGVKSRKELPAALCSVTPAAMSYWVRKKKKC